MKNVKTIILIGFVLINLISRADMNLPAILQSPYSRAILPGSVTRLYVIAGGAQPLSFQWLKNGIPIPFATNDTYAITNAQLSDVGAYSVIVSNIYGVVESYPANIIVDINALNNALFNTNLLFKTDGENWWSGEFIETTGSSARGDLFLPGGNSWIETEVVGPGRLYFYWKLDGDTNDSLEISIMPKERVVYDNTVDDLFTTFQINGYGEVGDQVILNPNGLMFPLLIDYFSFTYWGTGFSGNEQMDVRFYLNDSTDGRPNTLVWESGWFSIPPTPKSVVIFDKDLNLTLSSPSITWAIQLSGIESGESAGLWIFSPPAVGGNYSDFWIRTNGNWELRTAQGINIDFESKIAAKQLNPTVLDALHGSNDWASGYVFIPSGTNIVRWTLKKSQSSNRWVVSGWLQNVSFLEDSPPQIVSGPESQAGVEGGTAKISVSAIGPEPMFYQWYKDGVALSDQIGHIYGADSPYLRFSDLQLSDSGWYAVYISNSFGSVMSSYAELSVYPSFLKDTLAEALDNTNLIFTTGGNDVWNIDYNTTQDGVDSASARTMHRPGVIWMETVVLGPGTLSYYWRLNTTNGILLLFVDGIQWLALSEPSDWTLEMVALEAAEPYYIRWEFIQFSPDISEIPVAYIDQVRFNPPATFEPPGIIQQPYPAVIKAGENAYFFIYATGTEPLEYQWYKDNVRLTNNVKIQGATNNVLMISNVQSPDIGNYYVEVKNAYGTTVSSNAWLRIYPLVAFGNNWFGQSTIPPGLFNVVAIAAGANHSLALNNDGTVVGWGWNDFGQLNIPSGLSNVVAISAGELHSLALLYDRRVVGWGNNDFGQINIPPNLSNVVAISAGGYHSLALKSDGTVVAWGDNSVGQVDVPQNLRNVVAISAGYSHSAALLNNGKVVIWGNYILTSNPQPQGLSNIVAIAAGKDYTLALGANGKVYSFGAYSQVPPGLSNIVAIDAGYDFNLAIRNDGKLFAWANTKSTTQASPLVQINDVDNVIAVAEGGNHFLVLQGDERPYFVNNPRSTTQFISKKVIFAALASGAQPINYQWMFNNSPLPYATNAVLIMDSLTIENSGNYYCIASNYAGTSTSAVANLTVVVPLLPSITAQPIGTNVILNQEIRLYVQATGAEPLYYQWQKDGSALVGQTNNLLKIVTAKESDGGSYTVIVSNDFGYILSTPAVVNVFVPPLIIRQPADYDATPNASFTLLIDAYGSEPLLYQWRKEGVPILSETNSTLNLVASSPDISGLYDVVVSNPFGFATSRTAKVTIGNPPQIISNPTNTIAVAGSTVQFSVAASGTPPLMYQWRLNDFDIPNQTNPVLVIQNVSDSSAGLYSVMVVNKYGFDLSQNASLTVITPPRIIEQSEDVESEIGKTVLLSVSAIGTEPIAYQWFKDGLILPGQTSSELLITNVNQQNGGVYWVLLTNIAGSVVSEPIKLTIELHPDFLWARRAGGIQQDSANALAIDKNGNIVVVCGFNGSIDASGVNAQSAGNSDILILKYSPNGDLIWLKQAGGPGNDLPTSVAIGDDNSIYVGGFYEGSASFGTTNISQSDSSSGIMQTGTDIFVAKYNSNGELIWVKSFGGAGNDSVTSMVVDRKGYLIFAGNYEGVITLDSQTIPSVGGRDIFIAKCSPNGELIWVKYAGGFEDDKVNSIAVDDDGNIFITGAYSRGTRFGNTTLDSLSTPDMFLAKYNSSGELVWVKSFAGAGIQEGKAIAIDPTGQSLYVAGIFGQIEGEPGNIVFGQIILTSSNKIDLFIARFDSSGNPLMAKGFNYDDFDIATSIAVNPRNNILLNGFISDEINKGIILLLDQYGGKINEFILDNTEVSAGMFTPENNYCVVGSFVGTTEFGTNELTSAGGQDAFVGKISSYSSGPPLITSQPPDRQSVIGGSVRFEVGVIGSQPLYFQWFKGNQPIPYANDPFYEIKNASFSDEGIYFVIITNLYGTVRSRDISFSIGTPPVIIIEPQDVVASLDEDVYFNAQVDGTPPLSFMWYHNGVLIQWANSPMIRLSDIETEDAGSYQLIVQNPAGSVTSRIATLTIKLLPTITRQPESLQLLAGLKAEFSIEAKGNPPLYYQWYFNDAPLAGQTNRELKLYKVTALMAGNYYAVVSNPYGMVTSQTAILTVAVPPQILTQPVSQTVTVGGVALFSVTPVDPTGVRYQWFKNDKPIPGATNSFIEIQNVSFSDAGAYNVVLYNFVGGTKSDRAVLKLQIPELPFADNFENRIVTNSISGYGRASNIGATRQSGEPRHAGKRGTNSVWLSWVVPVSGIATLSLEGSSFDTLLAVYTGTNLTGLTQIAANDDATIGVKYSSLQFNVAAGTEYIIAVDGFGESGEIIMQWSLESTASLLPEPVFEPQDTNVQQGASITFETGSTSGRAIVEWYFNGQLIASNLNSLTIENVTPDKVGVYYAILREGSRVRITRPIRLQITQVDGVSDPRFSSQDKFFDALARVFENLNGNNLQHSTKGRINRNQGPVRGFTGAQVFNTYGSTTDPGEPLHCGVTGGASEWFVYQAPTNGLLIIDTYGSTFDTVLAVYDVAGNLPPNDYTDLRSVACNNDVSPTNSLSRVEFYATADTIYYIAVDGVGGATGVAQINYNLIPPPVIVTQPQSQSVQEGTNVAFSVTANGTNITYQWRFNSINISGQTNSTLLLTNVQSSSAGYYSVIVSNIAGVVISSNATLTVNSAPLIVTQPSNTVAIQGASATLIATATGTTPLRYQWLFNSTPIAGATNSNLLISAVSSTNSGQYNLVVSNNVGAVTSSPAYLTVLVPSGQAVSTAEDTPILITLGPASTNGVVLGYLITIAPTNGVLSGTGNLRTYSPVTNYSGADLFKFAIYDGAYTSVQATVTLTISQVNDPPVLYPITNIVEYAGYPISFVCSAFDVETPSTNLVFSLAGAPPGASITSSGAFSWTPLANQTGTNNFQIIVSDTGTPPLSATQSVKIVVLPLGTIEIKHIETTTNGLVRFLVQGRMNRTNVVESTILFNRWTVETNIIPSTELYEFFVDPSSQTRKFYRIKVDN
ncbi:MAG: immunoglobulin domain-containing protein [Verrucomicrobiia bacterium]